MNAAIYIRRFNISMAVVNKQKAIEAMIKLNFQAFPYKSKSNILFCLKFEKTVTKFLSSKSKPKEFFAALS